MKSRSTPSEKTRALINPSPVERTDFVRRHRILVLFKNIFGLPIPILLLVFAALLPAQTWFSVALGWTICFLSIMYIFVDRFSNSQEFHFFTIGGDLPILFFVISTFWGLPMTGPTEFINLLSGLGWILLIYMLAYTLDLFPGLNRLFAVFFITSIVISLLAIYQALTGQAVLPWSEVSSAGNALWPHLSEGFGVQETSEMFTLMAPLLLPLPMSSWLMARHRLSAAGVGAVLGGSVMATAAILTLRFETFWIALALTLILLYLTSKKYLVWMLIPLFFVWFSVDYFGLYESLGQQLSQSALWSWDLRQELIDHQLKIFAQSPWLGVGYEHNLASLRDFVANKGLAPLVVNGAPNTYFQLLVTTGIVGLALYLLFILASLLVSHRLLSDIPQSHYWHRVFVMASLGVQIGFHITGLFVWSFGYAALTFLYAFHVAVVAYMAKCYQKGIVPDDQAL